MRRPYLSFRIEPLEARLLLSVAPGTAKSVLLEHDYVDLQCGEFAGQPQYSSEAMEELRLDFDGDTSTYFGDGSGPTGDVTPTGESYMLYEHWGGTWSDAEKVPPSSSSPPGTGDDFMCWAGAASNVLAWTGWGLVGGMTTTDDVFQYFQDHWTDQGGLMQFGWDWWFDGTNDSQGWSGWSQVDVPGGGFYPSENFYDYFHDQGNDSLALSTIDSYLHAGYGVTLGIYGPGGHAITVWGYNYNPSDATDYYGLWITDSDDSKYTSTPPDRLRYYEVEYTSGQWYLQDYYGSDAWYIGLVSGLAPSESTPTPPPDEGNAIHGTVWSDRNGNGVWDSGEQGLSDQTVYLDLDNNGQHDTGIVTVASADVPKDIYDLTTVTSTLEVSGAETVLDVNVTLDITHTYDEDLEVYLISPSGTRVELFTNVGSWDANFTNTTLDDEAATSITEASAPFTGSFRPEGLLSSLDGEDADGTWTLEITDNWTLDTGTLNSWSLQISNGEPYVQTSSDGSFQFAGLDDGDYYVRHEVSSGWVQTLPGDGYYYLNLQDGAVAEGTDFGVCLEDPVYRFDFGTSTSPLASGYTQATASTAYTDTLGYGWQSGTLSQYDRATGTELTRDFVYTRQATFAIDTPDGTYDVTLSVGDVGAYAHDLMGVFLEGLQVGTLSTAAGEVATTTFQTTVADGRLTLLLDDLGGTDPFLVIEALEVTVGQKSAPEGYHFDFGTPASPLESGCTQLTASTAYSSASGYGWQSGALSQYDRATGTNLTRDFVYTRAATFAVDLDNGTYDVTLTAGDIGVFAHDQMGIFLEGAQVDAVTTAVGQVVAQTYQVTVADGQLTLLLDDLGGTDPFVVVEGLDVELSAEPQAQRFDFGTSVSPLESGYTQVTASTAYNAASGYGWQSGTLSQYDRATGTNLTRDFVYTRAATFAVDLASGTYDVSVTLGDIGAFAHDQMGVFLEGAQVDTVSTTAGQVVTQTYQVAVADGQLTLLLDDLGGTDPFLVVEALEITAAAAGHLGVPADGSPMDHALAAHTQSDAWVDDLARLIAASFSDDTAAKSALSVDFLLQAGILG